jgi:Uma2 family endonuclease
VALNFFLHAFVRRTQPGSYIILGESGPVRTLALQVRMPDLCYVSRERVRAAKSKSGILPVAPDLAVEILSPTNTRREMARKLAEYFQAGTRLVWYIDPIKRTVKAYTAVDKFVDLTLKDELDGLDVVPGFRLSLGELFDEAGPREE